MNTSVIIKDIRRATGLSQTEFAKKLEVANGTIGNYETDYRGNRPQIDIIKRLLRMSKELGLNYKLDDFYGMGNEDEI